MYLGIDLGTSGVKGVLVDGDQTVIDHASAPLEVARPRPLWSEQDPDSWWRATCAVMSELRSRRPSEIGAVQGIGLSGQMHGATLLDAEHKVLRPAILWNDGRSAAECAELERRAPDSRRITGNLAMPGFTAPKLLWVANHEPDIFARVATVLLPKDYLRLRMTGDCASDMSDSAGTLWLDVANRRWSDDMLAATGLSESAMPALFEGSQATGRLRGDAAAEWGVPASAIVAGGAGDNAAGAVGVGVVAPGAAFLSLGTSGVLFVSNAGYAPNPEQAVHAFCHCLPDTWHQMSVILSAASCLSWLSGVLGVGVPALMDEVAATDREPGSVIFLPYLTGERTPHNDPNAMGVFFGLTAATERADMTRAVLEGVAFAFADGQAALEAAGTQIGEMSVIGGGARSDYWGGILASVLGRKLTYHEGGEVGPAFGAARLGRLAATGEDPVAICTRPTTDFMVEPDPALWDAYQAKWRRYRALYRVLKDQFSEAAA